MQPINFSGVTTPIKINPPSQARRDKALRARVRTHLVAKFMKRQVQQDGIQPEPIVQTGIDTLRQLATARCFESLEESRLSNAIIAIAKDKAKQRQLKQYAENIARYIESFEPYR